MNRFESHLLHFGTVVNFPLPFVRDTRVPKLPSDLILCNFERSARCTAGSELLNAGRRYPCRILPGSEGRRGEHFLWEGNVTHERS